MNNVQSSPENFTRIDALAAVRERGLEYRDEPFKIACGALVHHYIDVKHAFEHGSALRGVGELITRTTQDEMGLDFDTVGGPYMGAYTVSQSVAMAKSCAWFSVFKDHSLLKLSEQVMHKNHWVVGDRFEDASAALWVEDAITTGSSSVERMKLFRQDPRTASVRIVGAVAVVDRGENAKRVFAEMGIPYTSLVTYADLEIPPVEAPNQQE